MADLQSTVEKEAGTIIRNCEYTPIVAQALQALAIVALARAIDGISLKLAQISQAGRLQVDLRLENQSDNPLKVAGDIRVETP